MAAGRPAGTGSIFAVKCTSATAVWSVQVWNYCENPLCRFAGSRTQVVGPTGCELVIQLSCHVHRRAQCRAWICCAFVVDLLCAVHLLLCLCFRPYPLFSRQPCARLFARYGSSAALLAVGVCSFLFAVRHGAPLLVSCCCVYVVAGLQLWSESGAQVCTAAASTSPPVRSTQQAAAQQSRRVQPWRSFTRALQLYL